MYLKNGSEIPLNKGDNTISIIGVAPDIPNIEHLRLASNYAASTINSETYDTYIKDVLSESLANRVRNATLSESLNTDTLQDVNIYSVSTLSNTDEEDTLFTYIYAPNMDVKYTFYKTVYFTEGQQIFLATNGIDGFSHVLEMFSSTSPEVYSWSAMSNSKCLASLNITIPETGLYYVRVRSYQNSHKGFCNLNVNGENYYDSIPIYSNGIRCTQETDQVYNTFTSHNSCDPALWIEEGRAIPGKIYAFNDDYESDGDYYWGEDARIKKHYLRPVHAALLSTYSSYDPEGKCDLYIKCPNSDIAQYFESLKADDAIKSGAYSESYNCISWSGSITSYWEWPLSELSSFYSEDSLTAFDNFYASRGFTRKGANKDNSVIDLWAYVEPNGKREYTHASVRKGADGNPHGYDWESKPGSLARTFHPRTALKGKSDYGEIVEHYIKNTTTTLSLEEEIANNTTLIEYVNFSVDEKALISQKIKEINSDTLSEFNILYTKWKNIFSNTKHSNPSIIAACQEYTNLYNLCYINNDLLYAIYDKLGDGDIAAIKLIEDLTSTSNKEVMRKARTFTVNKRTTAKKIIRPLFTNTMYYVKSLLAANDANNETSDLTKIKESDVSYSGFNNFSAYNSHNGISVNFTLPNISTVTLELLDMSGAIIYSRLKDKELCAGNHFFDIPSTNRNNVLLVRLIINNRVNVKKVAPNL